MFLPRTSTTALMVETPNDTPGERQETRLQHSLHADHLGIMEGAQQPAVPTCEYPRTQSPEKDQDGH